MACNSPLEAFHNNRQRNISLGRRAPWCSRKKQTNFRNQSASNISCGRGEAMFAQANLQLSVAKHDCILPRKTKINRKRFARDPARLCLALLRSSTAPPRVILSEGASPNRIEKRRRASRDGISEGASLRMTRARRKSTVCHKHTKKTRRPSALRVQPVEKVCISSCRHARACHPERSKGHGVTFA